MTRHVIIGAGPVATNAIESIREFGDRDDEIVLISDEPAHSRMALPYWLSGQFSAEHSYTANDASYQELRIDARIGLKATAIDTDAKSVQLDNGESVSYDNLLIATGARPLRLPIEGMELDGVQMLWTLGQTEQLINDTTSNETPRVLMIGAGFIGFIMLNAMHKRGWDLTVVERESHVLPRMMDSDAASVVEQWLKTRSINIHTGTTVERIETIDNGQKRAHLANGTNVDVDVVVVATGIQPNIELAQAAGIAVDDGILVDGKMRTSVDGVFAGGDVAQGPVMESDDRRIHPIQPTAVDHGRIAGANMAGESIEYPGSLLMNVLDCCGLQCASFGRWDDPGNDYTTIANARDHVFRRFVWNGDRLVGAIFAGRANDVGMLTDVGMIKGILQTGGEIGEWRRYLEENPFDVRRVFVAKGIADQLVRSTLLGRPAKSRTFQPGKVVAAVGESHSIYVGPTKK